MSRREHKAWRHRNDSRVLRQVRKSIKRNQKQKRVRRKDWTLDAWEEVEELDCATAERVMPRGERERRRQAWSAALERMAEVESEDSPVADEAQGARGTVVEVSEGLCRVAMADSQFLCTIRGTLTAEDTGFTNVVAVGDEVFVSTDGGGQGVIEAVMPRQSVLARPDVFLGHLRQVVVANADQLLIVSSWRDPLPWLELIDRYLVAAGVNHLQPVICLNKVDLADNRVACQAAMEPYSQLGYVVTYTSAVTGEGVGELRELLRERNTVLAGMSGVGKSSLLTAVQPGLRLRVGVVSARRHEGRHTTSQVRLLKLDMGGFVADTPGIREFGIAALRRPDLMWYYPEILAQAGSCRFADCTHTHEPGCAVRSAVGQGSIAKTRYHSYRKIHRSLPA